MADGGRTGEVWRQSDIRQRGSLLSGIRRIKYGNHCIFGILFYIWAKGQMKPSNILLRTIVEKEQTGNEKGIERRRGIFGKIKRK